MTTSQRRPPATAHEPVARVIASMEDLARRLAIVAFRSGHESGDVGHWLAEAANDRDADDEDEHDDHDALDGLWVDYWEEIYRHQFNAAYFAIERTLRADLRIRRLPDRGGDWFLDAIDVLGRTTKLPPPPRSLAFFDGASQVEAKVPRDLEKRITADRPRAPRIKQPVRKGELTGEGIPGLALGAGLETALALLGTPSKRETFGSIEFLLWPALGLNVSVCRPGYVVTAIRLFWHRAALVRELAMPAPRTFRAAPWTAKGGLAGGATAKQLLAAYGTPSFDNTLADGAVKTRILRVAGMRFELHSNRLVMAALGD